ncbi:MAG: hypothetical protein JSR58_07785 [Verrucomicrobia bacterium]|nr:hypothetical protein [Verrucomicrobiota bacterium]
MERSVSLRISSEDLVERIPNFDISAETRKKTARIWQNDLNQFVKQAQDNNQSPWRRKCASLCLLINTKSFLNLGDEIPQFNPTSKIPLLVSILKEFKWDITHVASLEALKNNNLNELQISLIDNLIKQIQAENPIAMRLIQWNKDVNRAMRRRNIITLFIKTLIDPFILAAVKIRSILQNFKRSFEVPLWKQTLAAYQRK